MKNAKVFTTEIKGSFIQIKAYKKENAVEAFRKLDNTTRSCDVYKLNVENSHQVPVEDLI